jgi:hypothetical protein
MPDHKYASNNPVWPFLAPLQAMAEMLTGRASAPDTFEQPILPGWTFGSVINVTERNSSAPDVEREIVAQHSYGQQLGWVIDALVELVDERPAGAPPRKALHKLVEMQKTIKAIKTKTAETRMERIRSDLALLKAEKPKEYHQFVASLGMDEGIQQQKKKVGRKRQE